MLYPPTIGDDEVVDVIESTDDEIDEGLEVKKKLQKRISKDFADGFLFDCISGNDKEVDILQSLHPYVKKDTSSTLEEKIERERVKLFSSGLAEKIPELVQEMEDISDNVREKQAKKRKCYATDSFFDNATSTNALNAETAISFDQMNLSRALLKAITACGFTEPTRIQSTCIPLALAGRDLCACSATGTGKTAAFMLPVLERLLYRPQQKAMTRVVVLTPTRELAIQTFQVSRQLSQFMRIDICLCAGGLDLKTQEAALRQRPDIVIATPGRLIDHLHNAPNFSLVNVEILVLDEADRMLDEAFADQMKEIIHLCAQNRQTMLFSATMTDQVEELAAVSLKNPVKLFITGNTETALNLRQEFVRIRESHETDRECIVAGLVTRNFPDHTIIFVKTKRTCRRLHIVLGLLGVKVGQLHSGLTQRQRVEALFRFKKAELDVLVSTDLAARGLDVEGVKTVINMDMPSTLKQYVHRVGRTARAGRVGRSISLVGESERKILKEIIASNKGGGCLKQRLISANVVEAYKNRIESLEESIERIRQEEEVERTLRLAQEELQRGKTKLEGNVEKRCWIKLRKPLINVEDRKKSKNYDADDDGNEEELRAQRIAEFQVRAAKRARKGRKLRAVGENHDRFANREKNKQKSGSSFTNELTDVRKKAVKRFRYGPEDADFKAAKMKKARRIKF
ncbi:DEAD box polypeptide 27 [Loa loa]|uniref:RNA helicase n=1 Tax=Loa loa TaxID=7209 RepID=A0A1I7VY80_LOALO|nr:DEAD box polypeptide 27 [Loa loa]EJD75750.1 DEAD box polypeptide 27 [Loa loa]